MTSCGVDNIEQTLFLGCSIIDFSCSLGLNSQPTEVTVRLVKDGCSSANNTQKVYYDILKSAGDIKQYWTGPDPGLNCYGPNSNEPPQLGACVYFRVKDFEFMGLLQSWNKLNVQTDQDLYEVKLTSPTEILGGCQAIIGDYSGPIKGFNIFNVYGFQEIFNSNINAPSYTDPNAVIDGPIMGSYLGVFGGADLNDQGMSWNKIKIGLEVLVSNIIPVDLLGYSSLNEAGRIIYFGGQANARFGLIPYDSVNLNLGLIFGINTGLSQYYLDLSEIPNVPDDYRILGPSIDVLSLISQICNDFGMDFYVDLIPIKDGNVLRKYIKIRTIIRTQQPSLDIVQQYVSNIPEVIDSSYGRELRNENTTTFLVGGQKQSLWQVDNGIPNPNEDPEEAWLFQNFGNNASVRLRFNQFFGLDRDGNAYVLFPGDGNPLNDYINLDLGIKNSWQILGPMLSERLVVTIGEMRAAEHSYDTWVHYSKSLDTAVNHAVVAHGYNLDTTFASALLNIITGRHHPRDITALHMKVIIDQLSAELRMYRQMIADIYTQSKSVLMVRVPWVASKYQIDTNTYVNAIADLQVRRTDDPTDGGWSEDNEILYLNNPSAFIDRLRQEDGRIKPFALFDLVGISGAGTTSSPANQFDTDASFAVDRQIVGGLSAPGSLLYYSFQQDDNLVYLDRAKLQSPRVVIRFNSPLDFKNSNNPFFAKTVGIYYQLWLQRKD
jgi:hypothetical protein